MQSSHVKVHRVEKRMKIAFLFLFYILVAVSCAAEVVNVVPGIFSKKVVSNGLHLPATNTFSPINTLTTTVHLENSYSIFVHYQFTFHTLNKNNDLFCKLIVNDVNAGSLIHTGKQEHKTPTGFWMANLNAGQYTFEIHYKSPVAINTRTTLDWQTAVLQVMWFQDAHTVSNGINCYPIPTMTNNYNNWGPIRDLEVALRLPNNRVILSAYQLSVEMVSPTSFMVAGLDVDGFYQQATPNIKGAGDFLSLQGVWGGYYHSGIHYFNVLYRTPTKFSFTDCQYNYKNHENLYAMTLPPSCKVTVINPRNAVPVPHSGWRETDLKYSLSLPRLSHVIIMYQFTGHGERNDYYLVWRIKIDSVVQKHTISHSGYTYYFGGVGVWQGSLNTGKHDIAIEYRNRDSATSRPDFWQTRALTIIHC